MYTIANKSFCSYKINGSRFDVYCFKINNITDIEYILKEMKKNNMKATHICYAYCFFNTHKEYGYDEDLEPKNSSGKQILNLIEKRDIVNILIVSVRYMNGNKLGLGLLTRSYLESAKLALEQCQIIPFFQTYLKTIILHLSKLKMFEHYCITNNIQIIDKHFYEDKVELTLDIPIDIKLDLN